MDIDYQIDVVRRYDSTPLIQRDVRRWLRIVLWIAVGIWSSFHATTTRSADMIVGAGFMQAAIDDAVGATTRSLAVYPEVGYRQEWGRKHSISTAVAWLRLETTARAHHPHVSAVGWLGSVTYAHRWSLARYFQPHLRIGVEYTLLRLHDRFTIDHEGFLAMRYQTRRHRKLNALLGFSYHLSDYGWGKWSWRIDWHSPFGISEGFHGGFRFGVRYRFW